MKKTLLILLIIVLFLIVNTVFAQTPEITNGLSYLTSSQNPNGSWNDDPYSTALALRALANVKPNLTISYDDITFSDPAPTVGDIITISATIHNTGIAIAENVLVEFYDGDPSLGGVLIDEAIVLSIPAFGSLQIDEESCLTGTTT